MNIVHSFRHLDSSKSLKKYAEKRLERVKRFEMKDCRVNVTYSAERHLSKVEIHVHGGGEGDFNAVSVGKDFYVAVDKAVEKIESQMLRAKEKIKYHKKHAFSKGGKIHRLNAGLGTDYRPIVSGIRSRRAS